MDLGIVNELEWQPIRMSLREPFAISGGAQEQVDNVLIRVRLESGVGDQRVVGWGEAAPFPAFSGETQQQVLQQLPALRDHVVGRPARHWGGIARELRQLLPEGASARCGVEMALVDALARLDKIPLWNSLGPSPAPLVSDITITAGDIEHARQRATEFWQQGFRQLKVKVGREDVEFDIERLQVIHAAAPGARLVVDANGGFDVSAAEAFLRGVQKLPLDLLEQPLPRGQEREWSRLREFGVPLAADESVLSSDDVKKLSRLDGVDVINVKIMKSGIAEALSMVSVARAMGMETMIGGMVEGPLAMQCSAHLAAGLGDFRFVDLDTPFFLEPAAFEGGYTHERGVLRWDTRAHGIGVEVPESMWDERP